MNFNLKKYLFLLSLPVLLIDTAQSQSSGFFYAFSDDPWTFNKRNDDGTNPVVVYEPALYSIMQSAVDGSINKVYYYESTSNKIFKSNYDGSGSTVVRTTSTVITSMAAGNGYLFYAYQNDPYSVRRCNADGTNDIQIYLNPAYGTVFDITFDAANNFLYFYEALYNATNNRIFRTNADGSNLTVIYNNCPVIKSIAAGAGYIYFSYTDNPWTFNRRNSDGSSQILVYTPPTGTVMQSSYDATINKIFFYDDNVNGVKKIYKANPDGANITAVYSGFTQNINCLSAPTAVPVVAATVTTQAVSDILSYTATGHGTVTALGNPTPTQYGVVWSTSQNPTIALSTKTEQGAVSSTGPFTAQITGLSPSTSYYLKAYVTNGAGTSYGDEVSFTTTFNTSNGNTTSSLLTFYPNPTADGFYIKSDNKEIWASIYDVSGKLIITQQANDKNYVDISLLKEGLYIVKAHGLVGRIIKK